MAGLIWLWNQGGAAANDGYIATTDIQQDQQFLPDPADEHWATDLHATALDSLPAVQAGPPDSFDVTEATQEVSDEAYQWNTGLDEDYYGNVYGFPDIPNDVTPALFPPDPLDVTLAAQPHFGEWVWDQDQTEDYAEDSTLDTSWSLDFASGHETTIGTQPLPEQPWFPDAETEDYANESSLDDTPQFFPPAAQDDSYVATSALQSDQQFDPEPEFDWTQFLEQNEEFLAGPDPADSYGGAIGDIFDQHDWTVEEPTYQPYAEQNEGFITGPEIDAETAVQVQEFPGDDTWTLLWAEETYPESTYVDQLEWYTAGPPTTSDSDTIEAAQLPNGSHEPWFDVQDIDTELANDSTIDVAPLTFPEDTDASTATQYPPAEQPWFPAAEPDTELQNDTATDIASAFPQDPIDVTAAALDLFDQQQPEPEWFDQGLQDGAAEFISQSADDGYIAAIDLPSHIFEVEEWFDHPLPEGNEAYIAPDDGLYSANDILPQPFDPEPEQPEQPDTPLDLEWAQVFSLTDGMVAAVHHLAVDVDLYYEPEPEILPQLSTLDVSPAFAAPPPPSGIGPNFRAQEVDPRWKVASAAPRWRAMDAEPRWSIRDAAPRWAAREAEPRWP